ncbi:unnamed protein product [Miscanthus lutarioriparius]|uniref:RING-type domain-containing protein n=1 Tax=Miscanthus lutarioriparius TaxID=422564 RepID=A0A811Q887_9POAL|nr:unnamed protein product [Miscanthus lutarioriparius]
MSHRLADDSRTRRAGWRRYQRDPYSIHPAELDPVDLALALYRHGTSQSMMPTSSLTRPRSPPPSLQAASRRQHSRPTSKRARIPASSKAILGLKEVLLTTTTMDDDDDCAICLKALADPADQQDKEDPAAAAAVEMMTRLRAMPCSHIFHQHCIFQWLHRNAVCPLCRHQASCPPRMMMMMMMMMRRRRRRRRRRRMKYHLIFGSHRSRTTRVLQLRLHCLTLKEAKTQALKAPAQLL